MKTIKPGSLLHIRDLGAEVNIILDNDPLWPYYNPSIAYDEKGDLRIAIRACNFTVRRQGGWYLTNGDVAVTKVLYGYLDPETLAISGLEELKASKDSPAAIHKCGLEDGRLFLRDDGMHISGVEVDTSLKHVLPANQAEFLIDDRKSRMQYLRTLQKPDKKRVEKNWMPTDRPAAFEFSYSPTETWKGGKVSGKPYDGNLHGGTQLVWIEETKTWLAIIHDVKQAQFVVRPGMPKRRKRNYIHYLAEYSEDGQLQRLGQPFIFGTTVQDYEGIEFAAGMVRHKDSLIVSFGIRDAKMGIARIPLKPALKLLQPYRRQDETTTIDARHLAESQDGYPDIVIPVKPGGDHESLRYVLRSIEANWPHNKVWIIGEKPSWAKGVKHIQINSRRLLKYERIAEVWEEIAKPKHKISPQFVWFNDDIFVLQPITEMANHYAADLTPPKQTNYYHKSLANTERILKRRDDRPSAILNYDLHTPMIAWRKDVETVVKTVPKTAGLFQFRSMVGNIGRYGGIGSKDVKVYDGNDKPATNEQFMSLTDKAWADGRAGDFIRGKFKKKGKYEI